MSPTVKAPAKSKITAAGKAPAKAGLKKSAAKKVKIKYSKEELAARELVRKERVAASYKLRQLELQRLSKISATTVPNVAVVNEEHQAGEFPPQKALFPPMILSRKAFKVISTLIRSREPMRTAAELVLVQGKTMKDAARLAQVGDKIISPQMINNTVRRIKAAHTMICEAYTPRD